MRHLDFHHLASVLVIIFEVCFIPSLALVDLCFAPKKPVLLICIHFLSLTGCAKYSEFGM